MSKSVGTPTNLSRHAVFNAATNIYKLNYRTLSKMADQMEPFTEFVLKRIEDTSTKMKKKEYSSFEREFKHFKEGLEHTVQLSSTLGDLAFVFNALLPVGDRDPQVQLKIERMNQGKTSLLILQSEVEILRGKMQAGCNKIGKLLQRLRANMEGREVVEEESNDESLDPKNSSAPKFFTFVSQSSSSSSSSTSMSSSMSPTYALGENVTEDIRATLLDNFDMDTWQKDAEELEKLEKDSEDLVLPSPEPTPSDVLTLPLQEPSSPLPQPLPETTPSIEVQTSVQTPLQEPSPLSFQLLPETTPHTEIQTNLVQNMQMVSERVQNLLTSVNLLLERDTRLQSRVQTLEQSQWYPIQKKTRTSPSGLNSRSISAPVSQASSRRPSVTLFIKKPVNEKIETLPSPEKMREVFTAKKEEDHLLILKPFETSESVLCTPIADQTPSDRQSPKTLHPSSKQKIKDDNSQRGFETSSSTVTSESVLYTPIADQTLSQSQDDNSQRASIETSVVTQFPLSFIADSTPPTQQALRKLHSSPRQKNKDSNSSEIVKRLEVQSDSEELLGFPTTPKKFETKKPDRSCGVSFVEWWKSCFSYRKVTDLDRRS